MVICPICGEENPARARFCLACGTLLDSPSRHGETRKIVTVVFSDLVGSTTLGEQLDPERLGRVMTRYFDGARRVFERHGGTVEKFIGDAVVAVFGVPSVHEDDAIRAVRAAGELGPALDVLNQELARERGVSLQVRIGVNTGEAVVSDQGVTDTRVLGDVANVAARLEQAAGPGEVLLAERTWRLVRDTVQASPVTPIGLRGKGKPVPAWRLLSVVAGASGHVRRLDAPMVGRKRQLRLLHDRFETTVRERACHLATVVGAAGVGKSRLVAEFLAGVGQRATILQGRCLSYGEGITFWPVAELLGQAAGLVDGDGPEAAKAKLVRVLTGEEHAALIAERLIGLLGLADRPSSPEEIPWAVRRLFEVLARHRPLIVVLDDLHWAEPTLLDLIEHVADWSRDAPLLLCCVARRELLDTRASLGGDSSNKLSILLEPLDPADSERLLEHLLGQGTLTEAARHNIVGTAEGNPLFVEELLGMLIDEGLLTRSNSHWTPTTDLATIPVPTSIVTLLAARLDRLARDERAVVERASLVGQVFYRDAVGELSSDADRPTVGHHLAMLARKDLIHPARSDLVGQDAFRFRHVLIREVAYQAMPKALRAELHERFAAWLERTVTERMREHPELLAHHLEQAYRYRAELGPVDEGGRALAHAAGDGLAEAGRRALALGDMPAAAKLLERAVALLATDVPASPELLVDLGHALLEIGAAEKGDAVLAEAAATVQLAEDPQRAWRVILDRLWLGVLPARERRPVEEVRQTAERAIVALTELGDDAGLARAWLVVSELHNLGGRFAAMAQAAGHAMNHAQRAGDLDKVDLALSRIAITLVHGPMPVEEAIRHGQDLLEQSRGRRRWEAGVLRALARLEAKRGRLLRARALLTEAQESVEDLGLIFDMAGFAWASGQIETLAGELVAAERDLRLADDLFGRIGDAGHRSTVMAHLAEISHQQGHDEEAYRLTEESEAVAEPDDIVTQSAWRRTRAKLVAAKGAVEYAERLARDAVLLAERTDVLEEHAAALMSMAEVLRRSGRTDQAVPIVRQALGLYSHKGNLVLSHQTQELLDGLTRTRP
jgi:class 3 adenylate cyclase